MQPAQSIQQVAQNEWLWTWRGICFGYREADSLFSYEGLEAGHFFGVEVYGPDGSYLGEVAQTGNGPRLISNVYKKFQTRPPFVPSFHQPHERLPGCDSQLFYVGHEDFPSPEAARRHSATRTRAATA